VSRETPRLLLELAALARIDELTAQARRKIMDTQHARTNRRATDPDEQLEAAVRSMWAMGDYDRFATELIWELGPIVVEAAKVRPGMRVLDVAAGTGNVAIRAAEAGAEVVASDLTPENFEAGRKRARARGVDLEWVQANAEALPFEDGEFDVVTSAVGAIFAPHHQRVADEMLRVLKPGGRIAMANFTPDGLFSDFLAVFSPYMPPPQEGELPPALWGSERHVRSLFGDRLEALEMTRRSYVERADSPEAYCEFFKQTFGPVVAIYAGLEQERAEVLDRAFLQFARTFDSGPVGGPAEYRYAYLLVAGDRSR
jgi:ubiquinone/menaquinone biosynthesis C-methylase UbiE